MGDLFGGGAEFPPADNARATVRFEAAAAVPGRLTTCLRPAEILRAE